MKKNAFIQVMPLGANLQAIAIRGRTKIAWLIVESRPMKFSRKWPMLGVELFPGQPLLNGDGA